MVYKTYNHIHNDKKGPKNIIKMKHFAALHHTSPNYTSLHYA